MDFSAVREYLEEECHFPIDRDELRQRIEDSPLEAPTAKPESIGSALDRTERTTFDSADDVVSTLRCTVGDSSIGRKHYDDRGGARAIPQDGESVSF